MLFYKIIELNRKSFKEILKKFLEEFSFDIDKEKANIKSFIKSRNSLAHKGRFFYDTCDKNSCKYKSKFEEFTFIINFVDKVILKGIGHSGVYRNFYSRKYEKI